MTSIKITSELRLILNRVCALYQDKQVPPPEVREKLFQLVVRNTRNRYGYDQVEQVVEGFMEFWELA